MHPPTIHAHSWAEFRLYLTVTPCPRCAGGSLSLPENQAASAADGDQNKIIATCKSCLGSCEFRVVLPDDAGLADRDDLYPIINPTDEPSRIIDVGQWITLFRVLLESAGKEKNKIEARRLGFEAAQCLEEAIKFYDDNDLPPEQALFTEATRRWMRDHPEQFSRERLMALRGNLPKSTFTPTRRTHRAEKPDRPAWWKFWRSP